MTRPVTINLLNAVGLAAMVFQWAATSPAADLPVPPADRIKASTALLRRTGGSGTAFCVDPAGLFVSTWRSLNGQAQNLQLEFDPGGPRDLVLPGTLLRSDKELDLAVLSVHPAGPLAALTVRGEAAPGQEVTVYGYPAPLLTAMKPAMTAAAGHIVTVIQKNGALDSYDFEGAVGPGFTGSPVVNAAGDVIGMIQNGYPQGPIHQVIPAARLLHFLDSPLIQMEPATFLPWQASRPQEFRILARRLTHPPEPLTVRLTLNDGSGDRPFPATREADGYYHVQAAPMPQPAGAPELEILAQDAISRVSCRVRDQEVSIDGAAIPLRSIKEMTSDGILVLTDGRTLHPRAPFHLPVPVDIGGQKVTVDLGSFKQFTVQPAATGSASVRYTVTVSAHEKVIGELSGVITVRDQPAVPGPGH